MNAQLMLLLEIQDLHLLRTSLLDLVEEKHFNIDSRVATEALDEEIGQLKSGLDPAIQRRCERGFPTLGRMVVPVIGGVCFGCFVSISTSRASDGNRSVETCESCGRFIYVLT